MKIRSGQFIFDGLQCLVFRSCRGTFVRAIFFIKMPLRLTRGLWERADILESFFDCFNRRLLHTPWQQKIMVPEFLQLFLMT